MTRTGLKAAMRGWPWYPTLIGFAFVVTPFADTPIDVSSGMRLLAMASLIGFALTILWVSVMGLDRGGAAAAITLMGVVAATDPARLALILAALALLGVEFVWSRRGTMHVRVPWAVLTRLLNTILMVVVVLQVGRGAWTRATAPIIPIPAAWTVAPGQPLPDVFLIIADAHARDDVLRDRYGSDMHPLRDVLVANGFDEAVNSYANHGLTRFSLAVLLNGRPLVELGQDISAPADERIPFAALQHSSGLEMFRRAGYEVTVVSSGFEHLPLHSVDQFIDVGPRTEYEQTMMLRSGAGSVFDGITGGYVDAGATRVLRQLDTLGGIARERPGQPKFVMVHLPAPHWPFVFAADCTERPFDAYTPGSMARGWVRGDDTSVRLSADQTKCMDAQIAPVIGDLVAARPGAVVVLLSDHGPEELLDWWHPDELGTRDRLANLFWARTPGHAQLFPEDITLVNVLPVLANAYLGTDIPLHSNDLYLGPSEPNPYFVPFVPPRATGVTSNVP